MAYQIVRPPRWSPRESPAAAIDGQWWELLIKALEIYLALVYDQNPRVEAGHRCRELLDALQEACPYETPDRYGWINVMQEAAATWPSCKAVAAELAASRQTNAPGGISRPDLRLVE